MDDVVDQIYANMSAGHAPGVVYQEVPVSYQTTLRELAELLTSFRSMRQSLYLPDMEDAFARKLYATYLSYLPTDDFAYNLDRKCDQRGCWQNSSNRLTLVKFSSRGLDRASRAATISTTPR